MTLPPCEGTVCRPAPPGPQSTEVRVAVARGVPVPGAFTGVGLTAVGRGRGVTGGEVLGDGVGEGAAGLPACQAGGVSMTVGAERATGGVCRVEPTTNWTVPSTAVTLAAVHDSHMNR
ncbi:hypothetical protein [Streptomyces sp. NPDC012888]|uniref:hypothetical protein n=1 Tax=Streptomyces sp. NPDC012888 TaxID=3364855 RepID=UPI0036898F35